MATVNGISSIRDWGGFELRPEEEHVRTVTRYKRTEVISVEGKVIHFKARIHVSYLPIRYVQIGSIQGRNVVVVPVLVHLKETVVNDKVVHLRYLVL